MKTKKHWSVTTHNEWPAIQASGQDTPFIVFKGDTALPWKSAKRWADVICDWMNEQMAIGWGDKNPKRCVMLSLKLKETQEKLLIAETQNKHMKENLELSNSGVRAALRALHEIT